MKIRENYKDEALYYELEQLKDIGFIKHLFTTRIGWTNENTKSEISTIFNIPETDIINVKQVHGTEIKIVDLDVEDFEKFSDIEADGLITSIPYIALITYHADCVPIYFIDKVKRIIGIAHGGWRGTYDNISGKMVDKLEKCFGSKPKDILVGIGPSIGPCCYEVSNELGDQFSKRYIGFKDIVYRRKDKILLDLWRVNYLQVLEKGIDKKNIILSEACTSCNNDKFHSYRKEKGTKNRMVAAISLKYN